MSRAFILKTCMEEVNFGTSIHSTEIEYTALRAEIEQRTQDLRSSSLETHIPLEGSGLCQRVTLWPERPKEAEIR